MWGYSGKSKFLEFWKKMHHILLVLIFDKFYTVLKAKGQQRPGFHDIRCTRKNQNCRSDDSSSSRSCMTVELECEILFIFADVSGRKRRREQRTYHQVYWSHFLRSLKTCTRKVDDGWGKRRRGRKKLTIIYRNLSSHAIQLEASSRTAWREMSSLFPLSSYFVLHTFEVRKSLCLSSLPSLQRRVQEWLVFEEYVVVRTRSYMYPLLLRRPLSLGCDTELPIHLWGSVWRYLRASSHLGRGTNGISGGGVQACLETIARTRLDEFGALWFAQSTRFAGLWYVFRLQGAIWEAIGRLYCDHSI